MTSRRQSAIPQRNLSFASSLKQLQSTQFDYRPELSSQKEKLLSVLQVLPCKSIRDLRRLYTLLLFNAAYPANQGIRNVALQSLSAFHERLKALSKKDLALLEQSGLPGSLMHGVYSYTILTWLQSRALLRIELSAFDEGALAPLPLLRRNFLDAEFELLSQDSLGPAEWLQAALAEGDKLSLGELLSQIKASGSSDAERDHVFEALRPIVCFTCPPFDGCLSFEKKPYLHSDGILKRLDVEGEINSPLPPPRELSKTQIRELLQKARLCLLFLNRETDPVSNCDSDGIEYYNLPRGFSLALFSQRPDRRLAFESYIGFMMFKNGIAVAYGGAWLFGAKSLLGINIFEAFRGGESSFLFAQLLRAYRQRFGPSSIEVESYQFGLGNPEGLKTGAFWFYYRFGFRPADASLRRLAEKEFHKIKKQKDYKCPIHILKAFTASNMVLDFEANNNSIDTSALSHYISKSIKKYFKGDRIAFHKLSLEKLRDELGIRYGTLKPEEKTGLDKLLPFAALCLDYTNMTSSDRLALKELLLEKGKSEFRFTELCAAFPFARYLKKV